MYKPKTNTRKLTMDSSDEEIFNAASSQFEHQLLINQPQQSKPKFDLEEPDVESLRVLADMFGHKTFRPLQWKIISSLVKEKRDNCAIMTTGYGKSLCYQFPAVITNGVTLVVSPLISLMEDQVLALTVANISACLLGTAQKSSVKLSDIYDNKFRVVYLTPEYCTGEAGQAVLHELHNRVNVSLVAIDEAHCVSSWGHDFRFAYRSLDRLKDIFPKTPFLAVTATATKQVKRDIIKVLKLNNPQVTCSGFDRPNLFLSVKSRTGDVMTDMRPYMTRRNGHWCFDGSTIIYCITRKKTEELCQLLNFSNIPCLTYHAGMSLSARKQAHEKFVRDEVNVIVATVAFGMGIDKPDIRNVIHWGTSGSIESYYQEVGRAGRDGLAARCITLVAPADFNTHAYLIEQGQKPQRKLDLLDKMKTYVYTTDCRRKYLLTYFEDTTTVQHKVCCDNCSDQKLTLLNSDCYEGLDKEGNYDFTEDAVKYLSVVNAMRGSYGHGQYILFLKGSKSCKANDKLRQHPCFGSGRDKSEDWWKTIASLLEGKKFLNKTSKTGGSYTYFVYSVSDKGNKLLTLPNTKFIDKPPQTILKNLKKKPTQSGWLASSTTTTTTTSQPTEETKEELDKRLELYRLLKNARSQLASQHQCMPYMVADDFVLMEMARHKPQTPSQLKQLNLNGLTDAKIDKFGSALLKIISSNTKQSIKDILEEHPLDNKVITSAMMTFELFRQNSTISEIAQKRGFSPATVVTHLLSLLKSGYAIKMSSLGVTESIKSSIYKAINKVGSNTMLTFLKNECPEDVTFDMIKTVLAYVQVREHLKTLKIPYEEFEDFPYRPPSASEDEFDDADNAMLEALCVEMEKQIEEDTTQSILDDLDSSVGPVLKKSRNDDVLDSPPREEVKVSSKPPRKNLPIWFKKK